MFLGMYNLVINVFFRLSFGICDFSLGVYVCVGVRMCFYKDMREKGLFLSKGWWEIGGEKGGDWL